MKRSAYYVLSCINQFALPGRGFDREEFVKVLVYGMFKPMREGGDGDAERSNRAGLLTRELLEALAFQLRMFRRRGTYPA